MLMGPVKKLNEDKTWLQGNREQIQSRKKIKRNPIARMRKSPKKKKKGKD